MRITTGEDEGGRKGKEGKVKYRRGGEGLTKVTREWAVPGRKALEDAGVPDESGFPVLSPKPIKLGFDKNDLMTILRHL